MAQLTGQIPEAIVEHLDELEELYLAEAELEKIRNGADSFSLDEVETELSLAD